MKNLLAATYLICEGLKLISTPGLRRYALLPIIINVAVFGAAGWWLFGRFDLWLDNLPFLQKFSANWLVKTFAGLLKFLFGAALLVVSLFTFTAIANLIAAPFNSLLAEKIEVRLLKTGVQTNSSWKALLASVPKTVASECRKMLYLCLWLIPLFLLHFIPLVQIAAPFLLMLFGAWMFSIEYLDYPMGNHGYGFKQVRKHARQHRMRTMGFGFAVAIMSAIPVLNLVAMPAGVAGATIMWTRNNQKQNS